MYGDWLRPKELRDDNSCPTVFRLLMNAAYRLIALEM